MDKFVTVYRPSKKAKEYAKQIEHHWQSALQSILEVGSVLSTSQKEMGRKEWLKMVDNILPFTRRTAEKLVKIANDQRISNSKYSAYLPPHWTSLHELTFLSDEKFDDGIDKGIISADAERKDILEYVKSDKNPSDKPNPSKVKSVSVTGSDTITDVKEVVSDGSSPMNIATLKTDQFLADWQSEAILKSLKALSKKHKIEFDFHPPSLEKIEKETKRKELGDKTDKWLTERSKTYNVGISQEEQDLILDTLYQMENKKYPLNTDPNFEFAENDIRNPNHKFHGERKGTMYPYCQKHKIVNRYATIETVDYEAFCQTLVLQHCRGNARAREDAHVKLVRRANSPNQRNKKFAKAALNLLIV